MTDDLYCEIYVGGATKSDVQELISMLFGGSFERNTLYLDDLVIDVRRNTDFSEGVGAGSDFVYWPVLAGVDGEERGSEEGLIEKVAVILKALWSSGFPAIAACDFEELLPWGGGINSPVMPPVSD
ncbi:hypothetical protein NGM33_16560 [Nocardiopsis dassonvillei]|uniref:hypothetical protein n=1 Tax=Nocardiopsis dassonvillei TaxID=2014 RepID=UPI0020A3DA35|nr:hypothetical protein [Nocardiopsis dassonvillei]MCP3014943.1 hypothetical protein [Nocardiopsis dassonvillei]